MPEECPPDFDNLNCVPDHLTQLERIQAFNLIVKEIEADAEKADPEALARARVWLEKCGKVDPVSAKLLINELIKELSMFQYAKLMAVPKEKYEHVIAEWAGEMVPKITFDEWMKKLDDLVEGRLGLSIHDLPDMNFRDAYDDGKSPRDFFKEDFRDALEEEGYDIEALMSGG